MRYLVALLGLVLAGCSSGSDFALAKWDLGSHWFNSAPQVKEVVIGEQWWRLLGDEVLNDLVTGALKDSPSLEMAQARVTAARGQRSQAVAAMLPTVDVGGSGEYSHRSQNGGSNSTRSGRQSNLFTAGFDASWEANLFGKATRGWQAAQANVSAAKADAADARLTLIGDVVGAYVDYRVATQREALTEAQVGIQQRTLDLSLAREKVGEISGLDAALARQSMASARANLPLLREQKEAARSALAILVGQLPTQFSVSESRVSLTAIVLPEIPIGMPSTLLERRPDILAAEENWRTSHALVGVAEAERFPTFSLTASNGVQSSALSNLLANGSGFWSLIPALTMPIFDGGARRAEVRIREAEQDESAAAYKIVVLNALGEVEGGLVNLREDRQRLDDLTIATTASSRAYQLSDTLYRAGETNLLNLLDAQRGMLSSQDTAAQAKGQAIKNWVAFIKAIGGGYTRDGDNLNLGIDGAKSLR